MNGGEGPSAADLPADNELLDLIEQLDADNERLRLRALEIMAWMEEAVTAQVAAERDLGACREQLDVLRRELDAIHRTKSWRLLATPRRWYGALQRHRRERAT